MRPEELSSETTTTPQIFWKTTFLKFVSMQTFEKNGVRTRTSQAQTARRTPCSTCAGLPKHAESDGSQTKTHWRKQSRRLKRLTVQRKSGRVDGSRFQEMASTLLHKSDGSRPTFLVSFHRKLSSLATTDGPAMHSLRSCQFT